MCEQILITQLNVFFVQSCGVYHKEFYMRKYLLCDIMEPLRPTIAPEVCKAIYLH